MILRKDRDISRYVHLEPVYFILCQIIVFVNKLLSNA